MGSELGSENRAGLRHLVSQADLVDQGRQSRRRTWRRSGRTARLLEASGGAAWIATPAVARADPVEQAAQPFAHDDGVDLLGHFGRTVGAVGQHGEAVGAGPEFNLAGAGEPLQGSGDPATSEAVAEHSGDRKGSLDAVLTLGHREVDGVGLSEGVRPADLHVTPASGHDRRAVLGSAA